MNVVIVDYGLGNLWSVRNAFEFIGAEVTVSCDPEVVSAGDKLVLPGVGSFGTGMKNLRERGLLDPLNKAVHNRGVPILGICLGMQLLADASEESPGVHGLGWISGQVREFTNRGLRLPHMGFNSVIADTTNPLFETVAAVPEDFYFVHSYHFTPDNREYASGFTYYGGEFISAVRKANIFGVQFHPEKSQSSGLNLISRFVKFKSVNDDG